MQLVFRILAVAGPAMFVGVMLAIGVILGGYWKSLPPTEFLDWFAQHGSSVKHAIPLVVVPTLIGLAGALWYDWMAPVTRGLWFTSIACIVVVLGITMIYFVPSNAAFAGKAIALDQVSAKLDAWLTLHNIRIALALAASVLGIVAISR